MKSDDFLGFCRTILVTWALFGAVAASAKTDRSVCDELMLSESFSEEEIQAAAALIDMAYARGLNTLGPGVARAGRIDAILVLILRDEAEYSLQESAHEYALSTLSLSGFCGQYGVIEDGYRLRSVQSQIAVLPWVSRARAGEILARVRKVLPSAEAGRCG